MNNTLITMNMALEIIDNIYASLDDLHDMLKEIAYDESLDYDHRVALLECETVLSAPELLDEIAARIGCLIPEED